MTERSSEREQRIQACLRGPNEEVLRMIAIQPKRVARYIDNDLRIPVNRKTPDD